MFYQLFFGYDVKSSKNPGEKNKGCEGEGEGDTKFDIYRDLSFSIFRISRFRFFESLRFELLFFDIFTVIRFLY
jgi:hypothetical protein